MIYYVQFVKQFDTIIPECLLATVDFMIPQFYDQRAVTRKCTPVKEQVRKKVWVSIC